MKRIWIEPVFRCLLASPCQPSDWLHLPPTVHCPGAFTCLLLFPSKKHHIITWTLPKTTQVKHVTRSQPLQSTKICDYPASMTKMSTMKHLASNKEGHGGPKQQTSTMQLATPATKQKSRQNIVRPRLCISFLIGPYRNRYSIPSIFTYLVKDAQNLLQ